MTELTCQADRDRWNVIRVHLYTGENSRRRAARVARNLVTRGEHIHHVETAGNSYSYVVA